MSKWTKNSWKDFDIKHIPEGVTLDSMVFSESRNNAGNNITLRGRVSQGDTQKLQDYSDALADEKVMEKDNQSLFSEVMPPNMDSRAGGYLSWYIICILKRDGVGK